MDCYFGTTLASLSAALLISCAPSGSSETQNAGAGNTNQMEALPSSSPSQADCVAYSPSPVPTDAAVAPNQDPTQVMVQFDGELSVSAAVGRVSFLTGDCKLDSALTKILTDYKATYVHWMAAGVSNPTPTFHNSFSISFPQGTDTRKVVALLRGLPHVTSAYISINSSDASSSVLDRPAP